MPNLDRPAYCDWEIGWWFTSSVRFSLPKALQMTYCEVCWKLTQDGGATRKDVKMLASLLMDTEENVRTILALPHFYDNPDGTFSHHTVNQKLEEQKDRRMAGKKAVEARWKKVKEAAENTKHTGRNTGRSTGTNANEGLLEGKTSGLTSAKTPTGTSRDGSAGAPVGRSPATRPPAPEKPHPDARMPVQYLDGDTEVVRATDGGWIHLPTGERAKFRGVIFRGETLNGA
jgi:hypothetical protein